MSNDEIKTAILENITRLTELPQLITNAKKDNNHTEEIATLNTWLDDRLLDMQTEAGMKIGDDGKKLYTNAEQRAKHARELAANDVTYINKKTRLIALKSNKLNAEIRLSELDKEFSARKAAIYGFTALLESETAVKQIEAKTMTQRVKLEV